MKDLNFDALLLAAKPGSYSRNLKFTDTVMQKVQHYEILSSAVRKMDVNKKETFIMKLKHLPRIAIVAIAIGALALLTGTTYAVVQTIQEHANIKIENSKTNEFGRQQLDVSFQGCSLPNDKNTTYELKEGGGLSAEDGVKALQASCDMVHVGDWMKNNVLSPDQPPAFLLDQVDTVTAISDTSITLAKFGEKPFPQSSKVLLVDSIIERKDLKVGDTVFYYPDTRSRTYAEHGSKEVAVFKVSQTAKYYGSDIQSYVSPRGPCHLNPERTCLQSNHINQTTLIIASGGGKPSINQTEVPKEVQGKLISYDASQFKLDVGKGVIYTFSTTSNIFDYFNCVKVYNLASFDGIYAKTDPEALKIIVGDNIDLFYLEAEDTASHDIAWSQMTGITLQVERIPNNLDVLRKY
ncbi:MAG: hypothetical protein ABIQ04_01065 [Candidatus Saccharimonadales bacterium]